ncbi:MAG: hypothetical protein K2H74_09210 [Paramuribaculum sp.]|nr:hypothetical protein [Paramuribaculum sp.]
MYDRLIGILFERKYDIIGISSILIAFAITAFAFALYSKGMYYDYYYDTQYELSEGYTNFHFMEEVGAIYYIWCTIVIAYCYFYGSWNIGKVVVWMLVSLVLLFVASTMVDEIVNFHPSSACTSCTIRALSPLTVAACAYAYALPFMIGLWIVIYMLHAHKKPGYIALAMIVTIGAGIVLAIIFNILTYIGSCIMWDHYLIPKY